VCAIVAISGIRVVEEAVPDCHPIVTINSVKSKNMMQYCGGRGGS
jgi:hypothetical protein